MEYKLPEWPIFDFHAHFPLLTNDISGKIEQNFVQEFGVEKLANLGRRSATAQSNWRTAWAFPDPEARHDRWEETALRWAQELDKYGIQGIVFTTGGGNRRLREIITAYPNKFVGFAHHDPEGEGAHQELERAITEDGMRGYKIFAPALRLPLSDRSFRPLWEVAEKHQIPVLIHFGILGGGGGIANAVNISPLALHDVAKGYPQIPFVVPHFGCGYPRELLHLCWVCENVYVDTSGNNEWVRWMPYDLTLEDLFRRFYQTVGPERIIFGTDSEWFPRGYVLRYLLDQLRVGYHLRLSEEDLQKIFGGNARRLLKWGGDSFDRQ